jgi:hypothetical protein
MSDEVKREDNGDYRIHSGQLTAQTGISLGLLVAMIAIFGTLLRMSNDMVRWQERVDSRLCLLENRINQQHDPWSGTMMAAYDAELSRILSRQNPDVKMPNVRAIQKAGAELEWSNRK